MKEGNVAFVWDNFGPLHVDRCNAVASLLDGRAEVFGIEIFAGSDLYDWEQPDGHVFCKETLFQTGHWPDHSKLSIAREIVRSIKAHNCGFAFLSHYDQPAILLAAIWLRATGVKIFTMGCSKFDDAVRFDLRERAKRLFMLPYSGAIGSHDRSIAYLKSLGLPAEAVVGGYNTVDQQRIRSLAEMAQGSDPGYAERPFLAVARLIWEKNFPGMFRAYYAYCKEADRPRRLQIAGSGPLEADLKSYARELGIAGRMDWLGFVQTEEVAPLMRDALCLLLPSVSETFGNVVPEALALDLPVLASTQCGATDRLVVDGISGLTFAPGDDPQLGRLMLQISQDETLWQSLRAGARSLAPLGHTDIFAQSAKRLIES